MPTLASFLVSESNAVDFKALGELVWKTKPMSLVLKLA